MSTEKIEDTITIISLTDTPAKRGRGRPIKLHTTEDKVLANRAGFKKYMESEENKALQRARYADWFARNKEALYARRKAKRDAKAEKERLNILGEIQKAIANN
jgi:hypothetical protein